MFHRSHADKNLVKDCIDVLSPLLTSIVNSSLQSGVFPDDCKLAIIRPLIKRLGLDANALKNYRPVSNCGFLDKLLENVVLRQLHPYVHGAGLYGKCQSAYREAHSTETALLRVHNDVMRSLDRQTDVVLLLLDLSAAFDTIDHGILLNKLHYRFGIERTVLNWLNSYL